MAQSGLFLFIFVQQKLWRKIVSLNVIRTRIFRVEDEHTDSLTTTTTAYVVSIYIFVVHKFANNWDNVDILFLWIFKSSRDARCVIIQAFVVTSST